MVHYKAYGTCVPVISFVGWEFKLVLAVSAGKLTKSVLYFAEMSG